MTCLPHTWRAWPGPSVSSLSESSESVSSLSESSESVSDALHLLYKCNREMLIGTALAVPASKHSAYSKIPFGMRVLPTANEMQFSLSAQWAAQHSTALSVPLSAPRRHFETVCVSPLTYQTTSCLLKNVWPCTLILVSPGQLSVGRGCCSLGFRVP